MHPCWNVSELTRMIFEHIDHPAIETLQGIRYRLALTCRQFSGPALDLLWRRSSQGRIYRLLEFLPKNAYEKDGADSIRIILPLEPRDWDPVLAYTRRIRHLSVGLFDEPSQFDSSILESLIALPTGFLLPNVQSLFCDYASALFSYLPVLVGPRLSKIEICGRGPLSRLSAMESFATTWHSLEDATLYGLEEIFTKWSSYFVARLKQPRFLSFVSVDTDAYRHMAAFRTLEILKIERLESAPFPVLNVEPSQTLFPALRDLELNASDPYFLTNFVTALRTAPLHTLIANATKSPTVAYSDCTTFFSALYSTCHLTRLTLLNINLQEGNSVSIDGVYHSLKAVDVLQPLLGCRSLRCLRLKLPFGLVIESNEFVEEMARAWPNIELLSLSAKHAVPPRHPTIMALISFSRHCPRLSGLVMPVNATEVRMDDAL
ncbi:hypothetical protein R3P38DRAFT_2377998, partial [Favolaschia claudopus]